MLIENNISLTLVSEFADRSDIEEVEIVFIRYEKDSIFFLLKSSFNFHIWSPELWVVRPVSIPFLKSVRIPNFNKSNFLCSIVKLFCWYQRVCMRVDKATLRNLYPISTAVLWRCCASNYILLFISSIEPLPECFLILEFSVRIVNSGSSCYCRKSLSSRSTLNSLVTTINLSPGFFK